MLTTAETEYLTGPDRAVVVTGRPAAEWCVLHHGRGVPLPGGVSLADPVPVTVNHGRWTVECPDCASAQVAARSDPRFFCVECRNRQVGGLWRRVAWPLDADRIAVVLSLRPREPTRNWRPGETVGDLARENRAHELPDGLDEAG